MERNYRRKQLYSMRSRLKIWVSKKLSYWVTGSCQDDILGHTELFSPTKFEKFPVKGKVAWKPSPGIK
ncbi:hypothetical protein HOLleu_39766 [Holothuria leucospilota]|uniref:Uncharacterized protein n=1 Tax=Holothuria leucospilota TaxID=206669 RepID=A0A9Q0YEW2_HOLLE|nr:hypothetical protein HOLleu_39766 [Holothuria leucospilota]